MKLSKVILENKKIVAKTQLEFTNEDIERLTEAIASKLEAFLVMAPVCQCSSCLPVVSIISNSSSGTSFGAVTLAGTNFPLPVSF